MRVMVMIGATSTSKAGLMPSEALLTEMGKFRSHSENRCRWIRRRFCFQVRLM